MENAYFQLCLLVIIELLYFPHQGDWYNYGNANDKLNYCPDVDGVS